MIETITNNPTLKGQARLTTDIIYTQDTANIQKLHLLQPWEATIEDNKKTFPLIIFLQGSGWTSPDRNYQIPQLSHFAQEGFIVATITHRSFKDGHVMPAFLEDSKTAVRFLRTHAEQYKINPNQIAFFGTSSGGNTALLMALTSDDIRYKSDEWTDQSDAVNCVIDCFGPTDLIALFHYFENLQEDISSYKAMIGGEFEDKIDLLKEMSPYYEIDNAEKISPILMLHGDSDVVVPLDQSLSLYEKMEVKGLSPELVIVKDAPHEGSFWSNEVYHRVLEFIKKHI